MARGGFPNSQRILESSGIANFPAYHQRCHVPPAPAGAAPWSCRRCVFAVATKVSPDPKKILKNPKNPKIPAGIQQIPTSALKIPRTGPKFPFLASKFPLFASKFPFFTSKFPTDSRWNSQIFPINSWFLPIVIPRVFPGFPPLIPGVYSWC